MAILLFPMLLHSVSVSIMLWGYNKLSTVENDAFIKSQYGGHFQYLTIQSLFATCLTMLLGLGADLVPSIGFIRRAQRSLMMITLPVSGLVFMIYWSLLLVDPNLILQPNPNFVPSSSSEPPPLMWISLPHDLALHACPALSLLADFMLYHNSYSSREVKYGATSLIVLASVSYAVWVEYCASHNKMFPYPFLTENPVNIRIGIYSGVFLLALTSFRAINSLHPSRKI